MKYDLTQPLRDHRGNLITETTRHADGTEVTEPIRLGAALERACVFGGDPHASAGEKFEQFKLAQKVTGDSAELTAAEVQRIKELCGSVFSAIGLGAVWHALENPVPPVQEKAGGTD